jgi:hypothetical protein
MNVLKEIVKRWMDTVANEHYYFFQKGTWPAHNAKASMVQCLDILELWPKEVWSLSSPD